MKNIRTIKIKPWKFRLLFMSRPGLTVQSWLKKQEDKEIQKRVEAHFEGMKECVHEEIVRELESTTTNCCTVVVNLCPAVEASWYVFKEPENWFERLRDWIVLELQAKEYKNISVKKGGWVIDLQDPSQSFDKIRITFSI